MSYDSDYRQSFVSLLGLREPVTDRQILHALDERPIELLTPSVKYSLFDPPTDHLVRPRYITPAMLRGLR